MVFSFSRVTPWEPVVEIASVCNRKRGAGNLVRLAPVARPARMFSPPGGSQGVPRDVP